MKRYIHKVLLFYVISSLWIACDSNDPQTTEASDPDPYNLGDTYHDYRSCAEAQDNRTQESSTMTMEEEENMMTVPEEEMVMSDSAAFYSELPRGNTSQLETGLYFLSINFVELNFPLDLQMEVESMEDDLGETRYVMRLRAIKDEELSESFAEDSDVTVNSDSHFVAQFFDAVLPGPFSPTGSNVNFNFEVIGSVTSAQTMCGFIVGEIQTLGLQLEASTFYAQSWDDRADDQPRSCNDSGQSSGCQRLTVDQCPDLTSGENTITSCGIERQVRIRLPSNYDSSRSDYKTIVLFHGLTDDLVDDIEEDTGLPRLVDPFDFILISPYSRRLPIEWDQASPGDNADVALFEDLLTCAQAKLSSDPERLYVAGDSGGGMFTTFLVSQFNFPVAAAAINSGGTIFDLPETSERPIPIIYGWGGNCDIAKGQNFETLAESALTNLSRQDHFIVACNHDSGHEWKPLFSPWFLEFLFAHTKSMDRSPFIDGLPDTLPEYCGIYQ